MPDAPRLPTLTGDDVTLRPVETDDEQVRRFTIEAGDETVGHIELQVHNDTGTARVSWQLTDDAPDSSPGQQALRLVVEHAFGDLHLHRVEAYVDHRQRQALRTASVAGLRKEGLVRDYLRDGEDWADAVVLSRLASDPEPFTRDAFTAWLNSSLPTKRAIAQALIRDPDGRVLACELVYKKPWDLPGGVVDPAESPATAVLRELSEELGVTARIRSLAAVSWLPAWRGWDDATLFLFEVETDVAALTRATLQPREIRAIHWCDEEQLAQHAADYTVRVVREAITALDAGTGTAYLEDGKPAGF